MLKVRCDKFEKGCQATGCREGLATVSVDAVGTPPCFLWRCDHSPPAAVAERIYFSRVKRYIDFGRTSLLAYRGLMESAVKEYKWKEINL